MIRRSTGPLAEVASGATLSRRAGLADRRHQARAVARRHCDVLARALAGGDMANHPTEWWYWSFGDRYWALTTSAAHAVYGPIQLGADVT